MISVPLAQTLLAQFFCHLSSNTKYFYCSLS